MVRVKICGIAREEDALAAVSVGAWAVGFVFYKKSPRYISPSRARKIVESLPPFVTPVGVFVDLNERAVRDICRFTRIQTVQLHGEETPQYCSRFKDFKVIKAFRVCEDFDFKRVSRYAAAAYLFDAYQNNIPGGTGQTFAWERLEGQKFDRPVILSGGLNPENVQAAIRAVNPFAVDVSSGVEKAPGVKDARLVQEFIRSVIK